MNGWMEWIGSTIRLFVGGGWVLVYQGRFVVDVDRIGSVRLL